MRTLSCFAVLVALATAAHAQAIDGRYLPPGATKGPVNAGYRHVKVSVRPVLPGHPAPMVMPCKPASQPRLIKRINVLATRTLHASGPRGRGV